MNAVAATRDVCDYCQLPLPGRQRRELTEATAGGTEQDEPQYCCFGCRLAASVTRESGEEGAVRWTLARLGLALFFTMNVAVFTMALWTIDLYGSDDAGRLAHSYHDLFRHLSLVFSLPVLFLLGGPLLESAIDSLRRGVLSSDLLLSTGVGAAFLYSAVAVLRGHGQIYVEVGCVILVLVTFGRWLEATGKLRTTRALEKLENLLPDQVRRIRSDTEVLVPLRDVVIHDQLRVLAGERLPADGLIIRNHAFIDQQVLTGESQPVNKGPGDRVFGGTLNLDGELIVEVTATGDDSSLMRLVELVRQARDEKGHYERLADRASAWFFPVVAAIALVTLGIHGWRSGLDRGLISGLAVVLIACPCALGLATPMAVWTALGHAASRQVIFRSGEAFERLARITAIRFDKTGTLTTGSPRVAAFHRDEDTDRDTILRRASALASSSTHSLAKAVVNYAQKAPVAGLVSNVRTLSGRGVAGACAMDGSVGYLGSLRLMTEQAQDLRGGPQWAVEDAMAHGSPITLVAWGGRVRGVFVFEEQLRPSANDAIRSCHELHLDTAVLSGDHAAGGRKLHERLKITVQCELLPEHKVAEVRRVRDEIGPVAMVGDGINDAPALMASDVGIAMGCGTDVARDSALVCLLGDDLRQVPWSIELARRTVRVIRQNLVWAFGYNSVGIALAATGWLNPALAALLMVASSLLVITNSLRLGNRDSASAVVRTAPTDGALPDALSAGSARRSPAPIIPAQ
jgi:heavy metal translocating P-type ATPase